MFITKRSIPRRTFLRGMGVSLALPLFDSMLPAQTPLAQTAATPKLRAGFFYMQHGAIMSQFTPDKVGGDFEFTGRDDDVGHRCGCGRFILRPVRRVDGNGDAEAKRQEFRHSLQALPRFQRPRRNRDALRRLPLVTWSSRCE